MSEVKEPFAGPDCKLVDNLEMELRKYLIE